MGYSKIATHVHPGERVCVDGKLKLVTRVEPILNRSQQRLLTFEDGSQRAFYDVQSPDPDVGVYKVPGRGPFRDGYAFEEKVAARVAHNYIVERAGGGPGDGGIDISAKARDDGHRLAVQCKDWPRSPVGEPTLQGFIDNACDLMNAY